MKRYLAKYAELRHRTKRFSWLSICIWTVLTCTILLCGTLWEERHTIEFALNLGRERLLTEHHLLDRLTGTGEFQAIAAATDRAGGEIHAAAIAPGTPRLATASTTPHFAHLLGSTAARRQGAHENFITAFTPAELHKPGNEWLRRAYETFSRDQDRQEYFEILGSGTTSVMNIVRPLRVEQPCLGCHPQNRGRVGDLYGGAGVAIPLASIRKNQDDDILRWGLSIVAAWLLGIIGIWFGTLRTYARLEELNDIQFKLKEKDEDLSSRTTKYELLFDSISDAVVMTDPDGTVIAVNNSFTRLSGYAAAEVIGGRVDAFFPDRRAYARMLHWTREHGPSFFPENTCEAECRKKNGSLLRCEIAMSSVRDGRDGLLGYMGIVRDISARRQKVEAALLRLKTKDIMLSLEGLQTSAPEEICRYGLAACAELSGSELALVRFADAQLLPQKELVWVADGSSLAHQPAMLTDLLVQAGSYETLFNRFAPARHNDFHQESHPPGASDGSGLIRRCLTVPVVDQNTIFCTVVVANKKKAYTEVELECTQAVADYIVRLLIVRRALAEKQQFEKNLQEIQKIETLGVLAGGIAHDLNNILGIISCNVDMALDDATPTITTTPHLHRIAEATTRARELMEQLLGFSRNKNEEFIPLNPVSLMKGCLSLLFSTVPQSIKISQQFPPESATILANPIQFEQVMINLFYNAVDALPASTGLVHVAGEIVEITPAERLHPMDMAPGRYFRMGICDTGEGITFANWDKVFDPFYTTKGERKGTGLGLSVARRIMMNHGGAIQFESEPGRGTSFHAFFPLFLCETAGEAGAEPAGPAAGDRLEILLVDDDVLYANSTATLLKRLGYQVTTSPGGEEALSLFNREPDRFDLVITDQVMPSMSGTDLARHILAARPGMPIMICTGRRMSEDEIDYAGIREICHKPFDRKTLSQAIDRMLQVH